MFNTKKVLVIPTVLLILTTINVLVPIGCASKNTNNSANIPSFSNADSQILTSAYTDYDSFKQSSSPDTARQELVQKLNTEKGVADVYLGDDGTSIFFTDSDGFQCIVDTFDPNEYPKSTTSYLPNDDPTGITDVNATKLNFSSSNAALINNAFNIVNCAFKGYQPPVLVANATSIASPPPKKVLILQPICPGEAAYTSMASELPALFTANGWSDADINLKVNSGEIDENTSPYSYQGDGSGLLDVKPEDYYNLNQYGVILFLGHAATGKMEGDPTQMYLEFANLTNQSFKDDPQLLKWAFNKQISVGFLACSSNAKEGDDSKNIDRLFIRSDLLQQEMGKLPQSYVQLASCYGIRLMNAFTNDGASVFMSWDNEVDPTIADNNEMNMVKLMLSGMSAEEAYNDSSVTKSDARHWGAEFLVSSTLDPNTYFLPAWINLDVPVLPAGTSHLKVDIFDVGKNAYVTENETLASGQTSAEIDDFGDNCFPPGPCSVSVNVFDSKGSTIMSNIAQFTLQVGPNNLTISGSKYQYTLSGSQDLQTGISFSSQGVTALEITLNGQGLGGASSNWTGVLGFNAQPGDVLEIRIWGTTGDYHPPGTFSTSLSPLWLTSWATGEQVKITDGGNFSQYFNGAVTVVFDITFTIPGSKLTTTPTSTSTTTSTTNTTSTISTTVTPTTRATTETPATTLTVTPTQTSTSLTNVKVWLTTTNDSNATPVSSFAPNSESMLYIWAQGGDSQTGDFTLTGILQNGNQTQLGNTFHATSGKVIFCGTWNGGFLNTLGNVTVNAISSGTIVGSTTFTITNNPTTVTNTETNTTTVTSTTTSTTPQLSLSTPVVSGLKVTINGVASPGTSNLSITKIGWDWGDGTIDEQWFSATHTYTTAGQYTVKATAYQSNGLTTTKSITVTVQP